MKAGKLTIYSALIAAIVFGIADMGIAEPAQNKAPDVSVRKWITKDPPKVKQLAGRVYVLDFWATWCSPCKKEIPNMVKLQKKYKNKGLTVLGLCQDNSEKQIAKLVKKNKINYPVAVDETTAIDYSVKYLPTVAVINHKGKKLWQGLPWDKEFEKNVAIAIKDYNRYAAIEAARTVLAKLPAATINTSK